MATIDYTKANEVVKHFADAIREAQEAKGYDNGDAYAFTLGYLSSQLASIIAHEVSNVSARRIVEGLERVTEAKREEIKQATTGAI